MIAPVSPSPYHILLTTDPKSTFFHAVDTFLKYFQQDTIFKESRSIANFI